MPLPADTIIEITYRDELYGQTILTTHHLVVVTSSTAPDVPSELQALADDLGNPANPFVDDWSAILTEDYLRKTCRAQAVYPTRSIYREKIVADYGDLTAPSTPPNIALSVTRQTSLPGRRGVGRVQLAGLPAASLVAGVWTSGAQLDAKDAMDNFLGTYISPTVGGEYRWVLYNAGLGSGSNYAPILNWTPQDTGRTMRRRSVRLGI